MSLAGELDLAALRQRIPEPSERITSKIRPQLDATAAQWVSASRLVAVALSRGAPPSVEVVLCTRRGVATAIDTRTIRIGPSPPGDIDAWNSADGCRAGAIFVVPGTDSTLRANGTLLANGGAWWLSIEEAYMHCPKAFVRARLWTTDARPFDATESTGDRLDDAARTFLAGAPFLFLATANAGGEADVSPRGDPAGFVRVLDERTILIPDRPGNAIVDSFRNVLSNPVVALAVLKPGVDAALLLRGRAQLTGDATLLAPSAVRDRAPHVGLVVSVRSVRRRSMPALGAAGVGPPGDWPDPRDLPSPGRAIVSQVEAGGRMLGPKGAVLDWMLRRDAKRNLY